MRVLEDCRAFFSQFKEQYFTTGSIAPSSRALGRALCKPLRRLSGKRRILEIGPGTGAVTVEILKCLQLGDHLDIVEINGAFVAHLRSRFDSDPLFQPHAKQVRILHMPLQEVDGSGSYDVLISGLPLNNFPLSLVEDIFRCYRRLPKSDGTLSYFEYCAIRDIKMMCVAESERSRLASLTEFLGRQLEKAQFAFDFVPFNLPPAIARHLRFA
ncbi:MAG: methyltransferase domain-containing protein [Gemmataceae bacterium]|nr:methyltransferase domain-containing protein [Gemmataceae bacterium]